MNIEELRAAAPDLSALRKVFAREERPAEEWPGSRRRIRLLADDLRREGESEKAAFLMIAALDDLGRFFEQEDDDTDFGWHRHEEKTWEHWACGKALRSALVDGAAGEPWRSRALAAIRDLNSGSKSGPANWFSVELLMPLSPRDRTLLDGQNADAESSDWTPPERRAALELVEASKVDADTMRRHVFRCVDEPPLEEADLQLERLYFFRRVANTLETLGELRRAALCAVEGLAFADEEVDPVVFDRSMTVVRTANEQTRVLEQLIEQVVGAEPSLRNEILEAAEANLDVLRIVRKRVGRGDPSDEQRECRELIERYEAATERDERRELARQLIFDFGDLISDARYTILCSEFGWVDLKVERLLSAGRPGEAFDAVVRQTGDVSEVEDKWQRKDVVRSFLEHGQPVRAARLVEPVAGEDVEFAELNVRALLASDDPGAADACLAWFRMRPTLETYHAIEAAVPESMWEQLDGRMRQHLRQSGLEPTLVDIAVEEEDVETLDELIPTLDGLALEHARGRIGSLKSVLSPEAIDHLESG